MIIQCSLHKTVVCKSDLSSNQIRKIEQRSRNILKSKANPSTDLRIPSIECAIKKKMCTFVFDCLQDNVCDPFKNILKERNTIKIQEITI